MTRQYNELVALFDNWDSYLSSKDVSANAAGTLSSTVDIYLESTGAKLQQLKDAWEDLYDSLLNSESINVLVDSFTALVNVVSDLVDGMGGGLNVLSTFGGMLMKTFSQDIGREIGGLFNSLTGKETKIQNLAIASLREEYAKTADEGNEVAKSIINITNKYKEYEKYLSNDDQRFLQRQIEAFRDLEVQAKASEDAIEQINNQLKEVGSNKSYEDLIKSGGDLRENLAKTYMEGQKKDLAKLVDDTDDSVKGKLNSLIEIDDIDLLTEKIAEIKKQFNDIATNEDNDFLKKVFSKENIQNATGNIQESIGDIENIIDKSAGDISETTKNRIKSAVEDIINDINDIDKDVFGDNLHTDAAAFVDSLAQQIQNSSDVPAEAARQMAEKIRKNIEDTLSENFNTEKMVTKVTEGIGAALEGVGGLSDTLSGFDAILDDNLSLTERFTQGLSGMGFGAISLIQAMTSLQSIMGNLGQTMVASLTATAAAGGPATAAVAGLAKSVISLQMAIGPVGWAIEAAVAALVAFNVIIPAITKNIYDLEKELAEAKEAFDELSDKVQEASDDITDFIDSWNGLQEIKESIDNCTYGTQEWTEAVAKNNEQVNELLDKYPQLLKQQNLYVKDKNGILSVNEDAVEAVQQELQQREKTLEISKQIAALEANKLQIDSFKSDNDWKGFDYNNNEYYQELNLRPRARGEQGYGTLGYIEEMASVLGQNENILEASKMSLADIVAQYQDIADKYSLTGEQAVEVLGHFTDSIRETGNELQSLNNETENIKTAFSDLVTEDLEDVKQTAKDYIGSQLYDESEELKKSVREQSAKELWGYTGLSGNLEEKDGKYYDEEGTEYTKKEIENIAIAKQLEEERQSIVQETLNLYDKISESAKDIPAPDGSKAKGTDTHSTDSAMKMLVGKDMQSAFSGFTREDIETFKNQFNFSDFLEKTLDPEDFNKILEQYGVENKQQLEKQIQNVFDGFNQSIGEAASKTSGPARQLFTDINESFSLSADGANKLADILQNVQWNKGEEGLNTIKNWIDNLPADQVNDAILALDNINWSDTNVDINTVRDQLTEFGVDCTNLSNGSLQQLIDKMREAAEINFDTAEQNYQAYQTAGEMSEGDTGLSENDYNLLDAETQSHFMYDAETSTYQLIEAGNQWAEFCRTKGQDAFSGLIEGFNEVDQRLRQFEGQSYEDLAKGGVVSGFSKDVGVNEQELSLAVDTNQLQDSIAFLEQSGVIAEKTIQRLNKLASSEDTVAKAAYETSKVYEVQGKSLSGAKQELEKYNAAAAENRKAQMALASTAKTTKELDSMLKSGKIGLDAYTKGFKALEAELDNKNLGEKAKQVDSLSKSLEKGAKENNNYKSSLNNINQANKDVREELRQDFFNELAEDAISCSNAIDSLADHYSDWAAIVNANKEDIQNGFVDSQSLEALDGFREALSGITDVEADMFDNDFIIDQMDNLKAASKGSVEAINEIRRAAGEEILLHIDNESFQEDLQNVESEVYQAWDNIQNQLDKLELGVELSGSDMAALEADFQKIISESDMTASQAKAFLRSMGFSAKFKTEKEPVKHKIPYQELEVVPGKKTVSGTYADISTTSDEDGNTSTSITHVPYSYDVPTYTQHVITKYEDAEGGVDAFALTTDGSNPEIEAGSLTYTGGNKGSAGLGSRGSKASTPSGGKSGGGGKGKKPKKGKNGGGKGKKDKGKSLERVSVERDKYYDINRQLSLYDQKLERINWHQDHYANSSYLKALDEELNLLRLQNIALQKKSDIEVHDLQSRQKTLKDDYKVKFTEDGLLDEGTYNKIRLKYKKKINDLAGEGRTEAEEKLYNKLKKQLDRFEKKVDKYNEIYDQHEETLMSMLSNQDRNRELNRMKIDERLEQIQEKRAIKTDSLTRATERYSRILSKLQDQESTYLQGSKAWLTNKGKQIEALEKQLAVQKRLAKYQKETAIQEKKEMQSDLKAMSKSSADSAYKRLQKENAKTVKKNTKTVVKKGPMGTSAGSTLAKDKGAAAKYNTYIKKKSKSKYKSLLSTWKKDNPEKKLLAAEKKKLLAQAKKQAKDTKKAKKLKKNVWVAPSKLKKKLDRKSWKKIYGVDFVQNKNTWTSKKQKKLTSKKKQNKNIDKKLRELGMKGAYTHAKVAALLKKNRKQRKKVYDAIKKGTINEAESTMMLRDLYKKNTDLNSLELKRNKNSKDIKSLTKEQNKSATGGLSEFQKYFVNDKNEYNQKKYNSFVKKMKKKGAWDKNGFKLSYDEDGMVSEKVRNAVNSLSDKKLQTWLNDKLDEIDNQTQEAKAAKELAEDLDAQAKQSKRDFRLEYVLNGNGRSGLNAALSQQNIEMSRLTYTMNRFNAARTKLAGRKLADNIEQENTALRLQLDILKSRATLINSSIKQLKENFKTEAVYDKDTGEKLGSLYNILTPELRTLWDKIDSDDATTEDYDNFTTALYNAQEDSTLSKNSSQILEVLNELIDKREESLENRSQQDENQDTQRENIITQQFAVIDNIQRKVEQINTSFADTFRLVNKELYETERAMNKAYGANKIKALTKMSEASKAEAEAQSALQQSLTNQASQAAQELRNFGLSIDENTGAILNEMEVLDRFDDKVNVYELTNIYGADYADRLHSAISNWHSLQDAIESAYEAEQNALDKIIENRLQQWQIKIQASIDFNSNVDSASEFTKMLYNVADNDYIGLGRLLTRKMGERSRLKLDDGTYTSADDLAKALKSLQEFQQTGNGEFGNNESAYIENLTSAKEAVENMTTTLHNDLQEAKDLLLNQIDYIKSENDRQISMIDNQKSINDTIKSITKILGNKTIQKNNDGGYEITEVGKLLEQRDAYNAQKLGWLTEERNFWQAQALSENFGGMPEEVQRKILDNLSETTQTLFSALETTLNDSLSKVQEMMEDTWNAWELDLGGGLSFDEINDDWTQEFKDSERYISDMELAYQMATIDKTYRKKAESYADDANAQKTILKILEDQLSILSKQEKVRKADVDLVKKKMDLTLAQIALEEAQNNKSKLRLSRDSQGNYTYRYVADDDNTEDAQVKAMEKSHDVYTASYNQWKDTQKQSMEELKTLKSELDKNSMSILSTPQEDNKRLEKLYEQRNKIVSRFNEAMVQLNKDFAIDNKNLLTASWADVKTMAASYASEAVPAAVQSASAQLDEMMKEANEEFILADGINRGIIEEFNELLYTSYDEWRKEALETCNANAGEITTLYDTNGIAPLALQAFGREVDTQFGNLSAKQTTTVTEFTQTHVPNYKNSIQEIMDKIQKLMDDSLGTGNDKDTTNNTWQGRMTKVIGQMDTLVDGHKGKIQDVINIIGAGIGGTSTQGATMVTALTQLETQSDTSIQKGAVADQKAWNTAMETGLTDLQDIYDKASNNAATFKENIAGPWKEANDELSKYLELAAKAQDIKAPSGSSTNNGGSSSGGSGNSSGSGNSNNGGAGTIDTSKAYYLNFGMPGATVKAWWFVDKDGNVIGYKSNDDPNDPIESMVGSGMSITDSGLLIGGTIKQSLTEGNYQGTNVLKGANNNTNTNTNTNQDFDVKQQEQTQQTIPNNNQVDNSSNRWANYKNAGGFIPDRTIPHVPNDYHGPVVEVTYYDEKKKQSVTEIYAPDNPEAKNKEKSVSKKNYSYSVDPASIATGGYTGEWGNEGRIAVLHEKELVLNKHDTANFLEALTMTRDIITKLNNLDTSYTNINTPSLISESSPTTSNITINADFPGVSQAHEIELAFESLKSKAAQRISQINR